MSMLEDLRTAFQDFIAPELRTLRARQEAADQVAAARHGEIMARFDAVDRRFDHLLKNLEFERRLERLEEASGKPPVQQ